MIKQVGTDWTCSGHDRVNEMEGMVSFNDDLTESPESGSLGNEQSQRKSISKSAKRKERQQQRMAHKKQRRKEETRRRKERRRQQAEIEMAGLTEGQQAAKLQEAKEIRIAKHNAVLNHLQECFDRKNPENCYRFCFNCSFGNSMSDKEISSLARQLGFCNVGLKTNLDVQIQYHITSYPSDSNSEFVKLCNSFGATNWKAHFHTKPYWDIFSSRELVVLSPDAEEELESVEPDLVYVIGGLVDRTVAKNESWIQARAFHFTIKKLPLKKYLPCITSPVLNINSVVDVMREWIRTKNWVMSLKAQIPQRKQNVVGPRSVRTRLKREKLSIASSARDFAIAEFEKLVNKANEHLSQGSNDESCLQISTEVFEALQILNCYVMRRVKRASIRKGFNYHNSRDNSNIMASTSVSDELDSYETPCENKSKYSEQYQLRITSIDNGSSIPPLNSWPPIPLSCEVPVPCSSLQSWLHYLKEEKGRQWRQRHENRWNCNKEWNNEASTEYIVSMFE